MKSQQQIVPQHDWKSDGPIVQFLDARNHIRSINVGSDYAAEQLVLAHNRDSAIELRIGKNTNIVLPTPTTDDKATAFCSKLDAAIEAENMDTAPRGEQWTVATVNGPLYEDLNEEVGIMNIVDAHNAALAAVRQECSHSESQRNIMSKMTIADVEQLRQELASEREKLTVWKRIAEAHDCRDLTDAFVQLTKARKQLDAEREKRIRWTNNSMTNLQTAERNAQIIDGLKSELAIAQDALAKAKEVK